MRVNNVDFNLHLIVFVFYKFINQMNADESFL